MMLHTQKVKGVEAVNPPSEKGCFICRHEALDFKHDVCVACPSVSHGRYIEVEVESGVF